MEYKDEKFLGMSVELDGNRFVRCTFDACTVHYRGGVVPELDDVYFSRTNFVLDDAALNTMKFLASFAGNEFGNTLLDTFFGLIKQGIVPGCADAFPDPPLGSLLN